MAKVNSVLGPLDSSKLGFTLAHEHLFYAGHGALSEYPELFVENAVEQMVTRLKEAKKGGVDTIVDMTTVDLGRDIQLMEKVSRLSGVNIIAVSGWWRDVPRFLEGIGPDQMAKVFIREIEVGIAGTQIKAGVLKSASDFDGVTKIQEMGLRAIARAHHKTGVPIAIHSYHPGQVARRQIAILKEESVDLKRVKFDHANDTTDVEYLQWILDQGCFLGLDRYPGGGATPLARTRTMKALIDAGYADRLCPSHDGSLAYILPDSFTRQQYESRNPHRFLYMKNVVFPMLKEMGVKESVISKLCVAGPRNFFEAK